MSRNDLRVKIGVVAIAFIFFFYTSQEEPFVFRKRQDDGQDAYEGYFIDLLKELAKTLHFTYHIKRSADGFFGVETKNGSWNGLIGEILNKVRKTK